MKTIYKNLDTSFVNLSALVRYLRRKNFVGNVRVELSAYEADIVFTGENEPRAREHDRNAGRISEGEQAFQRVLIRAREPGGIVHVFEANAENEAAANTKETIANDAGANEIFFPDELNKNSKAAHGGSLIIENFFPVQKTIVNSDAVQSVSAEKGKIEISKSPSDISLSEMNSNEQPASFPFEFSNNVEAKAKQNQLSDEDWKTLLSLISELLRTVDETLAGANLNFPAAFQKACAEVSADYPFLNPNSNVFIYRNGKAEMRESLNPKLFVASINETLRRILLKLSANSKYSEAERSTVQNILALMHHRKLLYDKFYITPQLEKTLRT